MADIYKLKNNPRNPRTITDAALEALKIDLMENLDGLTAQKIAHQGDIIISGNQRYKALKSLLDEGKITELNPEWFKDVTGWTQQQIKQWVITTNVNRGSWDWDILAEDWSTSELEEWGVALPDDWENNDEADEVTEDEAPELDETSPPTSMPGRIYKLGRHRLMCGSATESEDVAKLLETATIDLVHTDPPYGVDYKSKKLGGIMNDTLKNDSLYQFIFDAFAIVKDMLADTAAVYCWYEDRYRHIFQSALEDAGYEFKQNLIWNKGMNLSGADYQKAHENVLYLQKKGHKARWFGDRDKKMVLGKRRTDFTKMSKQDLIAALVNMNDISTVWDIDRDTVSTYVHPTQKPVTISARAIINSTEGEASVYDAFGGSGSTLMAAEQTGRTCYMMELDPKYVDVIRKRYHKFVTGEEEGWINGTPEVED